MMKHQSIVIELDGEVVRCLDFDGVDDIFNGLVHRERATHVEFDNEKQYWYVQDAKTSEIVATGFASRKEALEWEQINYQPGTHRWRQVIHGEKKTQG